MNIHELNQEQRLFLKRDILCQKVDYPSHNMMVNVDRFVTDEELEKEFGGVYFTCDDFI